MRYQTCPLPGEYVQPAFRLRISHEGASALKLEHVGGILRLDPLVLPNENARCVVTWNEAERLQGARQAVEQARRPTVLSQEPVGDWLRQFGAVDTVAFPAEIDGLQIEAVTYEPVPYATPAEGLRKIRSAMINPVRAVNRIRQRVQLPDTLPSILQITLPTGERLLHLNCALHRGTDADWLSEQAKRFGKADWTIVGVDFEESDAMCELIGHFEPQELLVTDLVNDVRTKLGLPTELVTPTVDKLCDAGFRAHVFATDASFRFE